MKFFVVCLGLFLSVCMITGNAGKSSNREMFFIPGIVLLFFTICFAFLYKGKKRDVMKTEIKKTDEPTTKSKDYDIVGDEVCGECLGELQVYYCNTCGDKCIYTPAYDLYCLTCKKYIDTSKDCIVEHCRACEGTGRVPVYEWEVD